MLAGRSTEAHVHHSLTQLDITDSDDDRLGRVEVDAVLAPAHHAGQGVAAVWPAGLTDREDRETPICGATTHLGDRLHSGRGVRSRPAAAALIWLDGLATAAAPAIPATSGGLHLACTPAALPVMFALTSPKADERDVARDLFETKPDLLATRAGQTTCCRVTRHAYEPAVGARKATTATRTTRKTEGMAAQPLRITLAGGCRVAMVNGTWDVEVPTGKGACVLARLALAAATSDARRACRSGVARRLPRSWERDLSAVVSRLRRVLRDAPGSAATVRGRAGVYELVLPPGSAVDVVEAERALRRGCAALEDDRDDEALAAARAAADIARRPMVPGARSVWLDDRRAWLRSLLAQALALQVEVAVARRDASGLGAADEAIATEPISERAYENAMRLHLALGEYVAAVDVYTRYRAAFVEELGLPPAPAIEALWAAAQGVLSPEVEAEAVDPSADQPRPGSVHCRSRRPASWVADGCCARSRRRSSGRGW